MIQRVNLDGIKLSDYKNIINPQTYSEIEKEAKDLKGLKIAHLNTTKKAGGVAELIRSFVPLQNSIGLEASWYLGHESPEFFEITKEIHNLLQGKEGGLTEKQKKIYLDDNKRLGDELGLLESDIWIIHDPQFAAVIGTDKDLHPSIWRCHIDTSNPNPKVWEFLLPYIKQYDSCIFHMKDFVGPDLKKEKANVFPFAIDPLSVKNKHLDKDVADKIVSQFEIDPKRPLVSQISRFDPWKDPWGVIDAYRKVKKEFPSLQLTLVGSFAPDDPEANSVVEDLRKYAGSDKDIHILSNLDDVNSLEVNAFQVASDVVVQKSKKEGFGMTVSEAMWKGKPVIGGRAGGIVEQIVDGETGFLVTSVEETAQKIKYLLENPAKSIEMGTKSKERVREKFLITRLLLDHLRLYKRLLK